MRCCSLRKRLNFELFGELFPSGTLSLVLVRNQVISTFPPCFPFQTQAVVYISFAVWELKRNTRSWAKQRLSSRLGIQVPVRQWGLSAQGKFYICLFRHKQVADRVISIGNKGNRRYIISITKNHNILLTFPNSLNMNCKRKLCSYLNEARQTFSLILFFQCVLIYNTQQCPLLLWHPGRSCRLFLGAV